MFLVGHGPTDPATGAPTPAARQGPGLSPGRTRHASRVKSLSAIQVGERLCGVVR
jgi:hypothetical protein